MSSPFTFFRKNQHVMMVGIVILSMVAFTVGDIFSNQQTQFVILGLMLGGIIFAFTGISRGRWVQYGLAGAALGALCGWVLPGILSPVAQYARTSKLGTFDNQRLSAMATQRNIANGFLSQVSPYGGEFSYGAGNDEDDLIFAEMLRAEADELGIVVTDEMVSDFINERTQERLSAERFAQARTSLSGPTGTVTEPELFDALREQIKARLAFLELAPGSSDRGMFTMSARSQTLSQGPEYYYDIFKRFRVSQKMNTTRLDVDAFISQVPDPSEAEIAALFDEHRTKFPGTDEIGSPGFRQPNKAKLAWLELSYKQVEESVVAPTDAEVEVFYNEKKDTRFKKPEPVPPAPTPSTPVPATPDSRATGSVTPTPDATAPDAAAPVVPGEPATSTAAPAEGGESAVPKTEESAPTESEAGTTPAEPTPSEQPVTEPAVPATDPPKPTGDECFPFSADEAASADEKPATVDPPAESTAAPTSEPPATAAAGTGTPPTEATATTAPAEPAAAQPTASTDDAAAANATPPEPGFDSLVIPPVEYLPLDEELKGKIRDELLNDRVQAALKDRTTAVLEEMQKLEKSRSKKRGEITRADVDMTTEQLYDKMREYTPTIQGELKTLGETQGFQFVESPLLSFELELVDPEAWPIGSAREPQEQFSLDEVPNVTQIVAGSFPYQEPKNDIALFEPKHAVHRVDNVDDGEVHYLWWIVEFAPSFVPKLTDPGIREQVILEHKRIKARGLAKQRGEVLAELVKADLAKPEAERKGMSVALEGQTVTGTPDAATLAVRPTDAFSWYHLGFVRDQFQGFRQEPQLAPITFRDVSGGSLRDAYNGFRKAVFEETSNNGVNVVSDDDLTSFYVVHVTDRTAEDDVLRQMFLDEGQRTSFATGPISSVARTIAVGPAQSAWVQALWDKYEARPPEMVE